MCITLSTSEEGEDKMQQGKNWSTATSRLYAVISELKMGLILQILFCYQSETKYSKNM